MKRARILAALSVLGLLAACSSGGASRSRAAGSVKSETTTTSSSTTTTTGMTGTTVPAHGVSAAGTQAGCPDAVPLDAGTSGGPRSLQMVSAQKGFAVDDTSIVVTDDGRTWSRRYSDVDRMLSVDAVDADHAWAVSQTAVFATSDGGRTWQPIDEPDGRRLRQVDFIDASNGWGVTGNHLFRTVDAGRTWQAVDVPCGGEAVCFTGPDDGWAAEGPHIYRSTNGGTSWEPAFTAPGGNIDDPFNPESIHVSQLECTRPGVTWAYFRGAGSGGHISYVAYRGTSAGQWTPVLKEPVAAPSSIPATAGGTYPGPMTALGPDAAVYVSFSPLAGSADRLGIRLATDGGHTMGPVRSVGDLFSATAISFLSPDVGWLLGAEGGASPVDGVLATTDGGRTWQTQYSSTIPPPKG